MTEAKTKKAVLYVFSGTGNTQRICGLYADALKKNGVGVTVHKITSDFSDIPDPALFDYVGIGYPIHAFNAPEIMIDFAKALPYYDFPESLITAQRKNYFIFKTSGEPLAYNNASSGKLACVLKRKGYRLTNEYHYVMPYNMIFRHGGAIVRKMWQTAQQLCPVDVQEILDGKKSLLKKPFLGGLIAFFLRIEQVAMRINGKFFWADPEKCINCGKCIRNCPTKNIKEKNDKPDFGWNCVMCARCSFYCPKNAINIAILNGWKVNGAYDFDARPSETATAFCSQEENEPFVCCTDDPADPRADFCRTAYENYFARAAKKIAAAKNISPTQAPLPQNSR